MKAMTAEQTSEAMAPTGVKRGDWGSGLTEFGKSDQLRAMRELVASAEKAQMPQWLCEALRDPDWVWMQACAWQANLTRPEFVMFRADDTKSIQAALLALLERYRDSSLVHQATADRMTEDVYAALSVFGSTAAGTRL